MNSIFSLAGRPVVVTGAAGLLGRNHSLAIAEGGGIPILLDIDGKKLSQLSAEFDTLGFDYRAYCIDSASEAEVENLAGSLLGDLGPIFGIVNNVAANPTMSASEGDSGRLETYSHSRWQEEHNVALGSAFLMAKHFGPHLVKREEGSIVNVASDLALISPDQRLYESDSSDVGVNPKKPLSYSSTKTAMLGITRYLATYWSPLPIRCNTLVPGSVQGTQSPELTRGLHERIPLQRLATEDEYKGAIIFLLSDASRYMNGATLVMDGGRSIW
jgi:NAD(P)-dependent dehydrogenase (short-subunit alcohol dehydrogenase family)